MIGNRKSKILDMVKRLQVLFYSIVITSQLQWATKLMLVLFYSP